jgi:hypothetical protein
MSLKGRAPADTSLGEKHPCCGANRIVGCVTHVTTHPGRTRPMSPDSWASPSPRRLQWLEARVLAAQLLEVADKVDMPDRPTTPDTAAAPVSEG